MFGSSFNQPPKNNPLETNSGNNLEKNKQEILETLEKRLKIVRDMEEKGELDTHPNLLNIFLLDPEKIELPIEKQKIYIKEILNKFKERKTTVEKVTGRKQYIFPLEMSAKDFYNLIIIQSNKKEVENKEQRVENFERKELTFNSYEEIIENLKKTIKEKGFSGFKDNSIDYNVSIELSREKAPKGTFEHPKGMSRQEFIRFRPARTMSLSQAVDYFTDEIKNGTFDENGTSRYIFLRDHYGGSPLVSICRRQPDGSIFLGTYPVDMREKTIENDPNLGYLG